MGSVGDLQARCVLEIFHSSISRHCQRNVPTSVRTTDVARKLAGQLREKILLDGSAEPV